LGSKDSDDDGDAHNAEDDGFIAVSRALQLVRDSSIDTKAPADVEHTVWHRIQRSVTVVSIGCTALMHGRSYPEGLSHHVHQAKAYIPVDMPKPVC